MFSGDLGRDDDALMPAPQRLAQADVLLVESTYGNRRHAAPDGDETLARTIRETVGRGGRVLLPAFAVGRAQALLHSLQGLREARRIPHDMPIFRNSPMASQATALYQHHRRLLRLGPREAGALADGVTIVTTPTQSERLTRSRYPCVILSASGMATGGRLLHHLKAMAPDARHHIAFAGFQVAGTRGAKLGEGAAEVKIQGELVPVRAAVSQIEGLSGHADAEGLMAWLRGFESAPSRVFVVHGEPAAADALRLRVQDELKRPVQVPKHLSSPAV